MISEDGRTDPENSEEGAEAGGGGGDEPWLKNSYIETLFSFFYNERKILRIQSCVNPWEIVFCSETKKRNNLVSWGKEISFSS